MICIIKTIYRGFIVIVAALNFCALQNQDSKNCKQQLLSLRTMAALL